ncbi:MAG: hydroxyethylthiazole kinase [Pseudomonadota bacterium]
MTKPLAQTPAMAIAPDRPLLAPERRAIAAAIDALKTRPPRVHAIVSSVAQPFLANIGAGLGIDVSMTVDALDAKPMALQSDAVLVNLGMLDDVRRGGIESIVDAGCPYVLDPVKVDRAPERLAFAQRLMGQKPLIVKGNTAEMAVLSVPENTVCVTTGKRDQVAMGGRRIALANGDPMMDRVIATGCAVGLLVTALACVEADPFLAAVAGVGLFNVAGEEAAKDANGPGSFAVALIDAVSGLDGAQVAERIKSADAA